MLCYVEYKTKDRGGLINKLIGRHFPYCFHALEEFRKDRDFNVLKFPSYHFVFLKDEDCNYLGVVVFCDGRDKLIEHTEKNVVEIALLEVDYNYHGNEYGLALIEWLQDRYPNYKIRLYAKNNQVMNGYYLSRGFKIVDLENRLLEYTGKN